MDSERFIEIRDFEAMKVAGEKTTNVDLSVVIPTFNESYGMSRILRALHSSLEELQINFEIILVDDDSPDETWKLIKELNHKKVNLIHRTKEKGLASALAAGVEASKGEVIVWLDCDLGIPREEIVTLIDYLNIYRTSKYM